MFRGIRLSAFIAGLAGAAAPVCAQEGPLTASATFYTGYYASNTKGDANQSLQFVPFGAKFDIKAFHDVVLEDGSMPLWVLREKVERWVADSLAAKK